MSHVQHLLNAALLPSRTILSLCQYEDDPNHWKLPMCHMQRDSPTLLGILTSGRIRIVVSIPACHAGGRSSILRCGASCPAVLPLKGTMGIPSNLNAADGLGTCCSNGSDHWPICVGLSVHCCPGQEGLQRLHRYSQVRLLLWLQGLSLTACGSDWHNYICMYPSGTHGLTCFLQCQ